MKRSAHLNLTLIVLLNLLAFNAWADKKADAIGDDVHELPIFDAHMHYKREAWEPLPVGTVLSLMDKSGVAMALVSSTPDEGTIRLWEYAPRRIVPELRPYHDEVGANNWTRAEGVLEYLTGRMEKYPHVGIGEFHIHQVDPEDRRLLKQVAVLAKQNNAVIHIHSGAEPVKVMFELEPSLTVIWAHVGLTEPPEVAEHLFAKYPRLYADTSYRETDILVDGKSLDPAWHRLILKYPDRFMVGSDTWVNLQWANYKELMTANRAWLSKLPRPVAEMIAYKNAEKLFGRKVDGKLIGTR
jgi:predicted TIM-barrel fold metal-dependent hydrolase